MKFKRAMALIIAMMIVFSIAGCANNKENESISLSSDLTVPAAEETPAAENAASAESTAENNDEISYEEGTSSSDNIVNTTAAEKVLLVVSFGTSFNLSRHLTIGGIEAALAEAYPDYQVRRAFTSQIIIDKLAQRDGLKIDSVGEAMSRLVLDKVKEVIVQPTTVMTGYEYNDAIEEVMLYADKFESLKIGKPLLVDDVDYDEVAGLIVKETSRHRADGTAIVFMGHGTEHEAGAAYIKLQDILAAKGYNDYVIGTVEHGVDIGEVRAKLAGMGVKKVVLLPLMIVAGDHANNDMADSEDEESWYSILTADGYDVTAVIEGLGQMRGIQELFIRHTYEAINSTELKTDAAAVDTGVCANRIKNGTYSIEVSSDTSMFRIVDCKLTVEDVNMTAVITMSGQGYEKIYMGTVEQALADTGENISSSVDDGERHSFTVSVPALDRDVDCAGLGKRSGNWFDHVVVFKTDNIPNDAFLPCQIDVTMTGGSGKAAVGSPAKLSYRDGGNYAQIIWSSPNYSYMLVDGVEYLPVNTEGNSTFEIPVVPDKDMKVIACTTAMSAPKEIEYVLNFDSASIR